jgi:hypothetical protein
MAELRTVKMDRADFLKEINKQILDARMNQKYHSYLEGSHSTVDRLEKTVAALFGSAAVASFAVWNTDTGKQIWLGLTAISAVASSLSAILGPAELARRHGDFRQRFTAFRYSLEGLRLDLQQDSTWPNPKAVEMLQRLLQDRQKIEAEQPPARKRVLKKAQDEILVEIGERGSE